MVKTRQIVNSRSVASLLKKATFNKVALHAIEAGLDELDDGSMESNEHRMVQQMELDVLRECGLARVFASMISRGDDCILVTDDTGNYVHQELTDALKEPYKTVSTDCQYPAIYRPSINSSPIVLVNKNSLHSWNIFTPLVRPEEFERYNLKSILSFSDGETYCRGAVNLGEVISRITLFDNKRSSSELFKIVEGIPMAKIVVPGFGDLCNYQDRQRALQVPTHRNLDAQRLMKDVETGKKVLDTIIPLLPSYFEPWKDSY